jgi:hypothetical protein
LSKKARYFRPEIGPNWPFQINPESLRVCALIEGTVLPIVTHRQLRRDGGREVAESMLASKQADSQRY